MSYIFYNAQVFICHGDVAFTDMSSMLNQAYAFNGDLSSRGECHEYA